MPQIPSPTSSLAYSDRTSPKGKGWDLPFLEKLVWLRENRLYTPNIDRGKEKRESFLQYAPTLGSDAMLVSQVKWP